MNPKKYMSEIERDYMNSLLALCSDAQQEIFKKMYPTKPTPKQLNHAITQLENTLKRENLEIETLKRQFRESKELVTSLEENIKSLESENRKLKKENGRLEKEIERLSSDPVAVDNADIQKDLALLAALEAGGVDNWEWYDEAVQAAGL